MQKKLKASLVLIFTFTSFCFVNCQDEERKIQPEEEDQSGAFYFGADLSYVNEVLDHGGIYKDENTIASPYKIFKDHGANLIRLRLWHHPEWTKEVYGEEGSQLYSDRADVEKSIRLSKEQGLSVLLDFHYSDSWADPGKQEVPAAWLEIRDIETLKDSVYQYTFKTLKYLDTKGLMPEFVQIGNEINCGMLYTNAPSGFPTCNVCDGDWEKMGGIVNTAIKAVNDVMASSAVKTKIILHVADPKNIEWWFDNMKSAGNVTGFDIIGISYYPLWHTTIAIDKLSDNISKFKSKYGKDVMILETAYPWTTEGNDNYNNLFGSQPAIAGYPFSKQGQHDIMKAIVQEVMDGGGLGVVYWEPAWISSNMKDMWGTGSSWENATFFDFDGNVIQGIDYMNEDYK